MRPGFATRRRQNNENTVRNTESQNPEGRSSRSPTVAAARSGVVASDKIHSAMDALRMFLKVPAPEEYDSGQVSERSYRFYL